MISIISFTSSGFKIGKKIENNFANCKHYFHKELDIKISSLMKDIYEESQAIVFISATGIAVRMISPYIKNKKVDPAVVVIDDQGKFIIPLLSGHLGGSNELSKKISEIFPKSTLVMTTASDSRGFTSPDLFAKDMGFCFYNEEKLTEYANAYALTNEELTEFTSAMVEGEEIYLYSEVEINWDYSNFTRIYSLENMKDSQKLIYISSKKISGKYNYLQIIPKNLHLGIGCRRGVSSKIMRDFIEEVFKDNNLLPEAIESISSIDLKSDEQGILELAKNYKAKTIFYSQEDLKKVEDMFEISEFVRKTVGTSSVAEGSCYLTSRNIIVDKKIGPSMTLAIGRK